MSGQHGAKPHQRQRRPQMAVRASARLGQPAVTAAWPTSRLGALTASPALAAACMGRMLSPASPLATPGLLLTRRAAVVMGRDAGQRVSRCQAGGRGGGRGGIGVGVGVGVGGGRGRTS